MASTNIDGNLPLTEATFFILLSIAPEPRHGYAIMKDVDSLSQGRITLSTGTLYGALKRLLELGWIERVDDGEQDETGRPARSSPLSPKGPCGSLPLGGRRPGTPFASPLGTQGQAGVPEQWTLRAGRPRKAYRLTRLGRRVLEAELGRLQALVKAARLRAVRGESP